MMLRLSLAAALVCAATAGMYGGSDAVPLSDSDFASKTASGVWLVEVYAEWCGHCKAAAPEVKKAASALKGIVQVGVVDGDTAKATAGKLGVQGFPTFKLLTGERGASPIDYNGPREAKAIVDFVLKEVSNIARRRLGGGGGGSSGGSSSGGKTGGGGGGGSKGAREPGGGKHVITGTVANFDKEVLGTDEAVLVEFYAPWCGHCKSLAGPLADAAEELAGEIKIVAVDATAEASLGSDYGVRGYPTLKFFPPGKKTKASAVDYNGGREKDDIVNALRNMVGSAGGGKASRPVELTGQSVWDEQCGGKRLCIVTFLPNILDENAERRNERLDTLAEVAGKVGKRSLYRFLWAEVGSQPDLERALNVGMVPALFAVSAEKRVFTPYRGPIDVSHVTTFANSLAVKAEGATKLPGGAFPPLKSGKPWDGKDGVAAAADEISLDELEL